MSSGRMKHTYYVVDQNYLRSPRLKQLLATRPDIRLVLPDLGMFEMAAPDKRELTVRLSLAVVAEYPNRVFIARSESECLKYELENGKPVSGHMLFHEATKFLRRILRAVASGTSNQDLDRLIHDPEGHMPSLKGDYLDHSSNKQRSLELVEATKLIMTADFARDIRARRATREEKIAFVREKAPSLLTQVLLDHGFSREKVRVLLRTQPMLLRYFYIQFWTCLNWEEHGRLECLAAKKVSNDLLDREYVLTASFFDGVLSEDERVNDAYKAITKLLKKRS